MRPPPILEEMGMQEPLAQSIVNSLSTSIAVIDRSGRIVLVNDAWTQFARENGDAGTGTSGVGASYLAVTQRACREGDALAGRALAGIEAVLAGRLPSFQLQYPCHSPTLDRWCLMAVTPCQASEGGAVIAHLQIASAVAGRQPAPAREEPHLQVRYQMLLESALQRRSFGQTGDCAAEAREMARWLARQGASPWEAMELHQRTLEGLCAALPPDRVAAALDEGRLMLLRVLGYMADAYRSEVLAHNASGLR